MNCCTQNCRQGRDCPVRLGTHKPQGALMKIDEPKPRYTQAPRYQYDKALGVATAIIVGIALGVMLAW